MNSEWGQGMRLNRTGDTCGRRRAPAAYAVAAPLGYRSNGGVVTALQHYGAGRSRVAPMARCGEEGATKDQLRSDPLRQEKNDDFRRHTATPVRC